MRRTLTLALALCLAPALSSAMTIIDEDFESYADTAALGGVWSLGDGTLDTAFGNPGQSLFHPGTGGSFSGANTNAITFADVYPGPGQTLILRGDIYDDGSSENKRTTIGLRTAAGANIIEMGMYNSPTHYSVRTVLFGAGSDGAWVGLPDTPLFEGAPVAVEGWHTFQAAITDSNVTFTLDLLGDGTIDSTYTANIFQNGANAFNQLRLGGPSDLSSPGGGVYFDNISLTLVPEPTAAVLAVLGLAGFAARRRG